MPPKPGPEATGGGLLDKASAGFFDDVDAKDFTSDRSTPEVKHTSFGVRAMWATGVFAAEMGVLYAVSPFGISAEPLVSVRSIQFALTTMLGYTAISCAVYLVLQATGLFTGVVPNRQFKDKGCSVDTYLAYSTGSLIHACVATCYALPVAMPFFPMATKFWVDYPLPAERFWWIVPHSLGYMLWGTAAEFLLYTHPDPRFFIHHLLVIVLCISFCEMPQGWAHFLAGLGIAESTNPLQMVWEGARLLGYPALFESLSLPFTVTFISLRLFALNPMVYSYATMQPTTISTSIASFCGLGLAIGSMWWSWLLAKGYYKSKTKAAARKGDKAE